MKRILVSSAASIAASLFALCLAGCPDEPKGAEGADAAPAAITTSTATPTATATSTSTATTTTTTTATPTSDGGLDGAVADAGRVGDGGAKPAAKK